MAWARKLEMWHERLYPYAWGLAFAAAAFAFQEKGRQLASEWGLGPPEIVSANFDVMITLTAFLFSVFVLAIAPGGGFIERIFKTDQFRVFKRYVAEALLLGSMSAGLSLPYMATKSGGIWNMQAPDALWIGLAIAAFLAFFRVVKIFIQWMRYDSKHRAKRRYR